jgi:hypothetical protein
VNDPAITIRLDGNGRIYRPGETLSGEYRLESIPREQIQAIEVSVLWYSEGKGDEDLEVHEFWRRDTAEGELGDPQRPDRFSTTLPQSPLSYEGQIIQIHWCVRVRAFLQRGRQVLGEKGFRLGEVLPRKASPP